MVLVLAVWGKYVFNRLWQKTLLDASAEARQVAQQWGLKLLPLGYGPSIEMKGNVGEDAVSISWTGGLFGERTAIVRAGHKRWYGPIHTATQFESAFAGEE